MHKRTFQTSVRRPRQSATLSALTLSLGLDTATRIDHALKPRIALEVLRGTHGTRHTFYALAEAAAIAGAYCAFGVEREGFEAIHAGSQECAAAYAEGKVTGIWAIKHTALLALARMLDVYDRQLGQVTRLQAEAARQAVSGRQQTRAQETETVRRAA
jgi:hypothetical protein